MSTPSSIHSLAPPFFWGFRLGLASRGTGSLRLGSGIVPSTKHLLLLGCFMLQNLGVSGAWGSSASCGEPRGFRRLRPSVQVEAETWLPSYPTSSWVMGGEHVTLHQEGDARGLAGMAHAPAGQGPNSNTPSPPMCLTLPSRGPWVVSLPLLRFPRFVLGVWGPRLRPDVLTGQFAELSSPPPPAMPRTWWSALPWAATCLTASSPPGQR